MTLAWVGMLATGNAQYPGTSYSISQKSVPTAPSQSYGVPSTKFLQQSNQQYSPPTSQEYAAPGSSVLSSQQYAQPSIQQYSAPQPSSQQYSAPENGVQYSEAVSNTQQYAAPSSAPAQQYASASVSSSEQYAAPQYSAPQQYSQGPSNDYGQQEAVVHKHVYGTSPILTPLLITIQKILW